MSKIANSPEWSEFELTSPFGEAICQVCDFVGANSHFGAITCRACAEFFRRSVHNLRAYKCKYSAGKGEKSAKQKVKNCRHCRMQKCQQIGMQADTVDSRLLAKRRIKKEENNCWPNSRFSIAKDPDHTQMQKVRSMCQKDDKFHQLYFAQQFPLELLTKTFTFGTLVEILEWTEHFNLLGMDLNNNWRNGPMEMQSCRVASCYQCGGGTINYCMTQSCLVLFDLVKTIPIFRQIDIRDKILHLRTVGMPFMMFCYFYNSCQMNIGTVLDRDGMPTITIFGESKYAGDKVIAKAVDLMFVRIFGKFYASGITKEEYVLLQAILLAQPVALNLSSQAQQRLQAESEKLGGLLLRLLQRRMGPMAGASRYADILPLIQLAYTLARKRYELITYLDIFYENGRIHKSIPPALSSFCTIGSLEMERN